MTPTQEFLNQVVDSQSDLAPEHVFVPPCWYPEQSQWVKDGQVPSNAAHNNPVSMRIRGPLNSQALQRSIQEAVRRHAVLRSVFRIVEGELIQMIVPPRPVMMPEVDLTGVPDVQKESRAVRLLLEDAYRPFDLTVGPMLRTLLIRLGAEDHVLLLTTHHIVCDFWSGDILARDVFTLYSAFNTEQPSPLPELTYSYINFVTWLNKQLQGSEIDSRLRFWEERLDGVDAFQHVTPDRAPTVARSYRGAVSTEVLPRELNSSIKQLSLRERVSPFMVMLAGLLCLLQRYSGQDDIGVGTCVANRPLPEVEALVGPFANVSLLRVDLSGNPTFRDVLRRVREESLSAYSCQDLPFGTIVEKFQSKHDLGRNPLFQLLFVFLNVPQEPPTVRGIRVDPMHVDSGITRYDLNLWVRTGSDLLLELQYNSDLFEFATIQKLLEDYRAVLEAMVDTPAAHLNEITIGSRRGAATVERVKDVRTPGGYRAPSSRIEGELVRIWESVIGYRPIGIDDDFFELGGHSLLAARIFAKIEQSLKVRMPLGTLCHAPTIAKLASAIEEFGSRDGADLLIPMQSGDARSPLFCIHGHSGSVLMYGRMSAHLGADQPVYGIQPQGSDGKQAPLKHIEEMAERYIKEIQRIQPRGPYFLAGYCMGGTIAFEMAQQFRSQGEQVGLLALLDTYNWGLRSPSLFEELCFNFEKWRFSWRHLRMSGLRTKLNALQSRCEELRVEFSNIAKLNQRAALDYVPTTYPGRVLHVCSALQYSRYNNPKLGWDELAKEGVERVLLRIYPWQMFEEPFVRELAEHLRRFLSPSPSQPAGARGFLKQRCS